MSIVTPVYQAERYLPETIRSVKAQTFCDWEWILVDDCSPDNSRQIVSSFADEDDRVVGVYLSENVGAAEARNAGIVRARGRYICFIDADDVWLPQKVERQLEYMQSTGCYFSYGGFTYMDEEGASFGAVVRPPAAMSYNAALRNTTILTSTVMIDMCAISKDMLIFPNVRRGQDTALWWRLLRQVGDARGVPGSLVHYRNSSDSLSSNRIRALKRTWRLYREFEGIGVFRASYFFANYALNALRRRL